MKRTKNMIYKETEESRELYLYTINNGFLWNRIEYVIKSLQKHVKKNRYDADRAVDAWYYIATAASDAYNKDFGYRFTVGDRFTVAMDLEQNFREDVLAITD